MTEEAKIIDEILKVFSRIGNWVINSGNKWFSTIENNEFIAGMTETQKYIAGIIGGLILILSIGYGIISHIKK